MSTTNNKQQTPTTKQQQTTNSKQRTTNNEQQTANNHYVFTIKGFLGLKIWLCEKIVAFIQHTIFPYRKRNNTNNKHGLPAGRNKQQTGNNAQQTTNNKQQITKQTTNNKQQKHNNFKTIKHIL